MDLRRSLRKRLLRHPAGEPEIRAAYRDLVGRDATPDEVEAWRRRFLSRKGLRRELKRARKRRPAEMVGAPALMPAPPEPSPARGRADDLPPPLGGMPPEDYVRAVIEVLQNRHPQAREIQDIAAVLRSGGVRRIDFLAGQLAHMVGEDARLIEAGLDTSRFLRMGTSELVSIDEWRARRDAPTPAPRPTQSRFPLRPRRQEVDVSVICSLWRGGDFIERYLDNITSQTIFVDRCELIVIDAASDQGEGDVVQRYAERFPGRIVYHRMPYRAGIYVAWNVGVGLAKGRLLTNANLDDLRRGDSLELQASALDALPHVDVVYQDHVYSADASVDFDGAIHAGVVSDLPLVTPHVMMMTNPPHNGPMWRASLHDRIGLFDEGYKTAGDYEFWLRAMVDGAGFYKLNDPHVLYYYNPEGLSTARNSRGIREARQAHARHGAELLPRASVESPVDFLKRFGLRRWPDGAGTRYAVVQQQMRRLAARHAPKRKGGA